MKRISALLFGLVLGASSLVQAQGVWNWPQGKEQQGMEKWQMFQDDIKNNNFKEARKNVPWFLENAPNVNVALYIKGVQVYEALASTPGQAPQRIIGLQDTVLLLHDLRIKHFGDEPNVLNRKGLYAYPYLIGRNPVPVEQLYNTYSRIIELNPTNTLFPGNALSYMDLMCRQKTAGKINDQQVLEGYEKIDQAYAASILKGSNTEAWNTVKGDVDRLLASCVTIDCQFVKNNMAPGFRANPKDITLAKKIASYMISGKCTEDPLFMEVANLISEVEPSYAWSTMLAQKEIGNKNYDAAIAHYQKAIDLADNNAKKAEAAMHIGNLHATRGARESARAAYRRALSLDPGQRDAYRAIGDLYMNSYKDCAGGTDPVQSRAVFLAAYDMYEKAGATSQMKAAKAQFPSVGEAHGQGKHEGEQISTGCWIGETASLRFRDK